MRRGPEEYGRRFAGFVGLTVLILAGYWLALPGTHFGLVQHDGPIPTAVLNPVAFGLLVAAFWYCASGFQSGGVGVGVGVLLAVLYADQAAGWFVVHKTLGVGETITSAIGDGLDKVQGKGAA